MTNKTEKQFFDTFGIEERELDYPDNFTYYPEITDRILLELICIAHTSPVITFVSRDVKSLKEEVLMVLCNWVNNRNIKHQVRTLFEEDINDRYTDKR